jgi:hypothetical protein
MKWHNSSYTTIRGSKNVNQKASVAGDVSFVMVDWEGSLPLLIAVNQPGSVGTEKV